MTAALGRMIAWLKTYSRRMAMVFTGLWLISLAVGEAVEL
jgi:hypothetical protein